MSTVEISTNAFRFHLFDPPDKVKAPVLGTQSVYASLGRCTCST